MKALMIILSLSTFFACRGNSGDSEDVAQTPAVEFTPAPTEPVVTPPVVVPATPDLSDARTDLYLCRSEVMSSGKFTRTMVGKFESGILKYGVYLRLDGGLDESFDLEQKTVNDAVAPPVSEDVRLAYGLPQGSQYDIRFDGTQLTVGLVGAPETAGKLGFPPAACDRVSN